MINGGRRLSPDVNDLLKMRYLQPHVRYWKEKTRGLGMHNETRREWKEKMGHGEKNEA